MTALGLHTTFVRPTFFMENFTRFLTPATEDGVVVLRAPLAPGVPLQMVAVDDIGKFSAKAFAEADKFKGAEIEYAGDAATMPEAAAALSELAGKTVSYQPIPIDAVRANSVDFALMLEWFDAVGYSADIPSLESRWGIRPLTLKQWVRTQSAK